MSEPKLISPMLDNFAIGDPVSDHNGVRCCPAMDETTGKRYIVKIVANPASQTQLDALLLTGAFDTPEKANDYFKTLADAVVNELQILQKLARTEGFLSVEGWQVVPMDENETGYEVYILSNYMNTLDRQFTKEPLTHLQAVNMGLDLCSALSACRRAGYLYVDLKPTNVYLTEQGEYRIGDIGFISLDSLKFASLPDKYRSAYTPPEISDAFSSLNTTLDTYAVGLLLYQAYNNGMLPDYSQDPLLPPEYADYELSEIILKAIHRDPAERWEDPVQMGQALVGYMQKNGVNDTPIIVPAGQTLIVDPVAENESPEISIEQILTEEPAAENDPDAVVLAADAIIAEMDLPEPLEAAEPEADAATMQDEPSDESSELSATVEESEDQTAADPTEDLSEAGNITEADSIEADHDVQNEEAALPPEEAAAEPESSEESSEEITQGPDNEEASQEAAPEESEDTASEASGQETSETPSQKEKRLPRKKRHWFRNSLIILLLLGMIAAGIFIYKDYYLQKINDLILDGDIDSLTVTVDTEIDPSLLTVTCQSYGNKFEASLTENKSAHFTGLKPNSEYTISVSIKGFHKLTGKTSATHFTPEQMYVSQVTCLNGIQDGSMVVNFAVDTPDSNVAWKLKYLTPGEPVKIVDIENHTKTIDGLTVGKTYSVELFADEGVFVTGNNTTSFTVLPLVYAQDLKIIKCADNELHTTWTCPEGTIADSWTVRCFNDNGYDETQTVTETQAVFKDLDHTQGYNVEVTAQGQSLVQKTFVDAHSVTIDEFTAQLNENGSMTVHWKTDSEKPKGGWILKYRISGSMTPGSFVTEDKSVTIEDVVPGRIYSFVLETAGGAPVFAPSLEFEVPEPEKFSCNFDGLTVTADNIRLSMCIHPGLTNWSSDNVTSYGYSTTYTAGQTLAFTTRVTTDYSTTAQDLIRILYVITDADGNIISTKYEDLAWNSLWIGGTYNGVLNGIEVPSTTGEYIINVYYNGCLVTANIFSVIS